MKVINSGQTISSEESAIDLTTGKRRYYLTVRSPLFENGKVVGSVGAITEITAEKEAKRLQDENRKLELENEKQQAEIKLQKAVSDEQEKFQKVVGQMVHDIQSPLSSLSSLLNKSSPKLPEDERNLVRSALNSITGITNHMLNRYRHNPEAEDEQKQPVFAYGLMKDVISEKIFEYQERSIGFTIDVEKGAEFSFIKIEPSAFKRMLSNLINNSVDALEGNPKGKIELGLRLGYDHTIIKIKDNGKGMPQEALDKIKEGVRYSAGKKDGHGLGFTQVWETLNRNNAQLDIYSIIGSGTDILLRFPEIETPSWIADEIKVYKDNIIVIVDDDESIHFAWDNRFKPIIEKVPEIQIKHFENGLEAISYINNLSNEEKEEVYLLTDYELLNQEVNGIDIIREVKVKHALLVTSHYANSKIRDLAIDAQVKLLPKSLAFAVKIKVDKKLVPGSRKVDMVWLDDDKRYIDGIIREEYKHLTVDTYGDPISFLEDVHQYPLDTRIILDHYYYDFDISCDLDGVKIAQELHDKGYTKLILTTGEQPNRKVPDYLQVVLKKETDKLYSLDKI